MNKSMPIFQGINFNETENDNSGTLNETVTDDESHVIMTEAEDVTTVIPDEEEVKVNSKAIFRRKPRVIKTVTNNVTLDNIRTVNLSVGIKHINQITTDVVSQPRYLSEGTTSVQTDHTIKSHLVTEGTTSKSLPKLLLFGKGINIQPRNQTIDSDRIYVPTFDIKISNETDKTDHKARNHALEAVRFKTDIKTISVPHLHYVPVDIAFRAQLSHSEVIPPKLKLNRLYGPIATRTTLIPSQISNTDTKQNNAMKLKWENLNKKIKFPKKVKNTLKKNRNINTENVTTIGNSQNFLKNIYLDVIDFKNSTESTITKSNKYDDKKKGLRVKRNIPESTTEKVVTIEGQKETTNLNVTRNSFIRNLNNILSKNLSVAVHEVFDELNMIALTPPDNKFPGSNLLFKIPSKYL